MKLDPPPPFEVSRVGDATVVARPRTLPDVEDALRREGTLFEWAASHPDRERMEGRGPLYTAPAPGGERWVVRHYRRGGAVAPLLGDRYLRLGRPRPVREIRASEAVRERGIDTPPVMAAVLHPRGIFYRADLATRWIPGSADLARTLFLDPGVGTEARLEGCRAAGRLVARLQRGGLIHPDLNAKNVLLRWTEDPPRPYVLDLDRCTVVDRPDAGRRDAMLARLRRSLEKWEAETGRALPARAWAAVREGCRREEEGGGEGGRP